LAPSGANVQPWSWYYKNGQIDLYHDKERAKSFLNINDWSSYIGLGAAVENVRLKSWELGYNIQCQSHLGNTDSDLVTSILISRCEDDPECGTEGLVQLVDYIGRRCTNRRVKGGKKIEEDKINSLIKMGESVKGCELSVITDQEKINLLSHVIGSADRLLLTNRAGHHHFVKEIRWDEEENELRRDGIDISTVDATPAEIAGLRMAKKWSVIKNVVKWGGGGAFEKISRKAIANSSAIGMITMNNDTDNDFFQGGIAMQRIWLEATRLGISIQPHHAAINLFTRLLKKKGVGLSDDTKFELNILRKKFKNIFLNLDGKAEVILFRMFISDEVPVKKSLRRPIDEVLFFD